jgi:mRNA interferase RelE/StbE
MFQVVITPAAERQMDRLPHLILRRITDALGRLRRQPRPPGCVKLHGADDLWRICVGAYRVVYTIRDDQLLVLVVRVAHRKDVYPGK